ncbi:putative ribonuclease H-like domain-containing protein [Tanacetum coccineum]
MACSIVASSIDASSIDASSIDASSIDARSNVASSIDAGSNVASSIDASSNVASSIDAGSNVASSIDAGSNVASSIDASSNVASSIDASSNVARSNPSRFQDSQLPDRVYKVVKAMYGLHQAPRAWYGTLSKYLLDNGFQRGTIDQTLFIRKHKGEFLLVQVEKDRTGKDVELHLYRSMIRSLMYLTASKDRYLKGHPVLGLWYPKESPFDLVAYSDSDYDDNVADLLTKAFDVGRFQYLVVEHVMKRIRVFIEYSWPVLDCPHWVETVDGATKIIATVNGRQRTINESSIKRHLKLHDAEVSKRTTRGTTWISQSKVPSPGADETASPTGDDRHGEAFPTATSLDAGQDRENIAKTSAMPHEASPGVTSLGGGEGSMQQKLQELMDMCTNLQQQHLLMEQRIQSAYAKKNTKKGSDSTDETTNVLSTLGAANELSSRVLVFAPTDIATIATVTPIAPAGVATASGSFPTTAIFTTASVKTPSTRKTRSSRGITIESSQTTSVPFISTKGKREGENGRIRRKQGEKDAKIARDQAKRELGIMIAELDRSNELIAKYMNEYEQAEADLSLEEKMELITELVKYQKNLAEIKKYQAQQSKPATKKEKRNYYMSILRSNDGWKSKDFKGMTFEQIEEKFIPLSEEELKKMMEIVPVEEVYNEALQVKRPIIDWEVYSEGQRKYWKISLVKNDFSTKDPTEDKDKMLWVELKRLYEPDPRDQLWEIWLGNMEMEPDIENMTISKYLEYEAAKERRLWDDVLSRRSSTNYYEAGVDSFHLNKIQDSIWEHDDDSEEDKEEDGDDGDTFDMWDITIEDIERIRKFFNVPDEIDEIVQPVIPKPIHTTPPNDDYVASVTKLILDELLEEFGDEIMSVAMIDEEADFNPIKDLEELERLLAMRPQSNFTEIQVDRDIISPGRMLKLPEMVDVAR